VRSRFLGRVVLICGLVSLAIPAESFVPRSHRGIYAVADANVKGRRVGALRFDLELHIGEGAPVATGQLVMHPTGMARLELRAGGGLVERHLLQGNQHSASCNSRMLVRPRAFLPPLFVLQSSSATVLEAAMASLGVEPELIGLAPCGDDDCFVLGDPVRSVRNPILAEEASIEESNEASSTEGLEEELVGDELEGEDSTRETEESPSGAYQGVPYSRPQAPEHFATIWVQTSDFAVRRVELSDGTKVELGPYVSFEKVMVPKWWAIEEIGKRPVRFEVDGVVAVNAPASAFSQAWLLAPVTPSLRPSAPDSDPAGPAGVDAGPVDAVEVIPGNP
jgi:hypothetical protein